MSNLNQEEFECKFTDVDVAALVQKLKTLGAKKQFDRLFRRYVFDYPDMRLNSDHAWLRVRDEGDKVTFAYKQRTGVSDHKNDVGMREIEVTVSDFEATAEILRAIGLRPKFYEENKRTLYILDDVEVAIDTWPLLNAYVEVEGSSWEAVESVAQKLGFNMEDKRICSTYQLYAENGINEDDYAVLTFSEQIKK